ncbi:IS200/IS605 family transposase [Marinoscillum sp.]|uniref:IS200/IS605 family transposase n=1 Tax=Marinoscillum sp. TaxID=2024838 RepID=UPI003BACF4BE
MANTYTQLYVHVVFAVRGRQNMISPKWKEELYKYITGIVTNKGQKLMIINGMPDHLHMLIGMKPDLALSDLIRDIKANSSKFINEKGLATGKFAWQNGFGAFTVGQSQKENVINYIKHQEEHHSHKTFREEYIGFLKAYEVAYSDEYIFE